MHQTPPPTESFFSKSVRLANQGVQVMGTVKGLYDAGRFLYTGLQAARPLLALL